MVTVVDIDAVGVDPAWPVSVELFWRVGVVSAI
jgi:hypothetical protein